MRIRTIGWKWLLGIVLLSILFIVVSCSQVRVDTVPDVDALLCNPKPKPPFTTSADAACFAAYVNGVANSLRIAQQQANYDGWIIDVQHLQDGREWKIRIRSTGKLPAFACTVVFTELGTLVPSEGKSVDCRYDK